MGHVRAPGIVVDDMMPRQGTMIADRYRLERKVGGGRVSAMWRVLDQVTDGTCAIKLLHRSMNAWGIDCSQPTRIPILSAMSSLLLRDGSR